MDGCDLIWDWKGCREKLGFINSLWLKINRWERIPFVCISPSFTPRVDNNTSRVFKPTIDTPVKFRKNVNIIVDPVENSSIEPLLKLIPPNIQQLDEIPKTIIYHDNIDRGILIARRLRNNLPSQVDGIPSKKIIPCLFGSIDLLARKETLSNFRNGNARIICMDPWGLDIDDTDIEKIIQWKVDENLDFSDLNERIGQVATGQNMEGLFHIYFDKSILDSISSDWQQNIVNWEDAWQHPDLFYDDYEPSDTDEQSNTDELEGEYGNTKRKYKKTGTREIWIARENRYGRKGNIHVKHLYREARVLRRAKRNVILEKRRTGRTRLSSTRKLDPAVLWLLCTQGCRQRLFKAVLKNQVDMED
jgi:hypothetical protein